MTPPEPLVPPVGTLDSLLELPPRFELAGDVPPVAELVAVLVPVLLGLEVPAEELPPRADPALLAPPDGPPEREEAPAVVPSRDSAESFSDAFEHPIAGFNKRATASARRPFMVSVIYRNPRPVSPATHGRRTIVGK